MGAIDFTDSIYDAQQGSQSAIKFIYDNTIQLFCNEANVFLRDKNEADQAIRDAYIFIFNHLNSLEDPSKFLLWANEVCKNTCIERLKDAGAFQERIPAEAANLGEILPSADYDNQINNNASMLPSHIQACLEAILDSLPDNQRACAVLWGEGYPIRSIARKLELSKVAVNYTLAYALGNITNSVTTLGENGLPLYSMDPIPYFLWLLINYYQSYEPQETFGMESSFANILRVLMPDEASVFEAEYFHTEIEESDGRVKHITDFTASAAAANASADSQTSVLSDLEPDISDFIHPKDSPPDLPDLDSIFDSVFPSDKAEEEPPIEVPPMDIYPAHKEDLPAGSETGEAPDFTTIDSSAAGESTDNEKDSTVQDETAAEEGTDKDAVAVAAAIPEEETVSDAAADSSEGVPEDSSVTTESAEDTDINGEPAAAAAAGTAAVDEALTQSTSDSNTGSTEAEPNRKKHTGLIVFLIVIAVIICLVLAAIFLLGNETKSRINQLLGTNILPTSESAEPETTTEEPTTTQPETTTEEETTTQEPETEAELTGPPYKVQIYADGMALGMHVDANVDTTTLLYVPSGAEVTIDEERDGWGHTTYDGSSGWIWLGYVQIMDNLASVKPETMLETPESYTIAGTGDGLELRTGPGTAYSTFGPIPDGTQITVEAYYEDWGGIWAYTSYNGHYGWISGYYLQ